MKTVAQKRTLETISSLTASPAFPLPKRKSGKDDLQKLVPAAEIFPTEEGE
jgi:hypothetical protein